MKKTSSATFFRDFFHCSTRPENTLSRLVPVPQRMTLLSELMQWNNESGGEDYETVRDKKTAA